VTLGFVFCGIDFYLKALTNVASFGDDLQETTH
jgi:hypothetical protein